MGKFQRPGPRLHLVHLPNVPVEGTNSGELVVAVVAGRVSGVDLPVTRERLRVVKHFRANITDKF